MHFLRFSLLVSASLICTSIQAQWTVGFKTGIAKSWEEYGPVDLPRDAVIHVHGMQVSGLVYYQMNPIVWLGIEPGYVERGAACKPGFVIFNRDTRLRLRYVELPLKVVANLPLFPEILYIRPHLGFGVAFATNAYEEVINTTDDSLVRRTRLSFQDDDAMRRWDYGGYAGVSLSYYLGKHQLILDGNYYRAVPNVDPNLTSRNRSLAVSLGYLIQL